MRLGWRSIVTIADGDWDCSDHLRHGMGNAKLRAQEAL